MLPTRRYPDRPGGSFEGEPHGSQSSFFVVDMVTVHASPRMETVWLDD